MKNLFLSVFLITFILISASCGAKVPESDLHSHEHEASTSTDHHLVSGEGIPFQLQVVSLILDSAGFEDIQKKANEAHKFEPGQVSVFVRTRKLIAQTTWPETLHTQARSAMDAMDEFITSAEQNEVDDALNHLNIFLEAKNNLLHDMNHWLEEAQLTDSEPSAFDLRVTQYYMDSAGFHDIAVNLEQENNIRPDYLPAILRIQALISHTTWPSDLSGQSQSFNSLLADFVTSLETSNLDSAIDAARKAHDAQHDLSHEIDHWIEEKAKQETGTDSFEISLAQYFMDTAGFHGMSTEINKTQKVEAGYYPVVYGTWSVLSQVIWPLELEQKAEPFVATLKDLSTAIEENNTGKTIELMETIHDGQHDLSESIDQFFEEAAAP